MSDSQDDHELKVHSELNMNFEKLSDVQRIEIRRRYDSAMAIGISAHKSIDSIDDCEKEIAKEIKHIWSAIALCIALLVFYYQVRFYTGNSNNAWVVAILCVLIHPAINLMSLLINLKNNAAAKSEMKVLEQQWMCFSPNFELREFIKLRRKNNLAASERGSHRMSALQLKCSIVNVISFKYSF